MGPWVVYVTGQGGLSNSERLTLSKRAPWEVVGVGADLELLMVHQVEYKSSPSRDQH